MVGGTITSNYCLIENFTVSLVFISIVEECRVIVKHVPIISQTCTNYYHKQENIKFTKCKLMNNFWQKLIICAYYLLCFAYAVSSCHCFHLTEYWDNYNVDVTLLMATGQFYYCVLFTPNCKDVPKLLLDSWVGCFENLLACTNVNHSTSGPVFTKILSVKNKNNS